MSHFLNIKLLIPLRYGHKLDVPVPMMAASDSVASTDVTKCDSNLPPATVCTNVSQIFAKARQDNEDCVISGIAQLSNTELVCADITNDCLKVIDLDKNYYTNRLELTSSPSDVTILPGSRLAVALSDTKQIQLYKTEGDMDPCGVIDVDGDCVGIHCTGSQLIVSYIKPAAKIQILDLNGDVQKTIQHDSSGAALFAYPHYVTYNPDNFCIYVGDETKSTVTCINKNGEVQWIYNDPDLNQPLGIATGDGGSLYVCSFGNESVHVVSDNGEKLAVISQDQSGITSPRALCYSRHNRTLFVSSNSSDTDECDYIRRLTLK